jgi:hypothetical protein
MTVAKAASLRPGLRPRRRRLTGPGAYIVGSPPVTGTTAPEI